MSGSEETTPHALRSSVLRGGALLFGRQMISIVLKFIGVLLISRVLGPAKYGSYVSAFAVYQFAIVVCQTGLGVFLIRHRGELNEQLSGTAYTILAISATALALALEGSRNILGAFVNVDGFSNVIEILAVAIPIQALALPAIARLERSLDYRAIALVEILSQFVYYIVAVPLVISRYGPISLAYAWFLQQSVMIALAHYYSRTWPALRWDGALAKEMIGYATSFLFANGIMALRVLVNPFIVGPALGANAVGIVGMTAGILEMLAVLKNIAWRLSVAVLPRFQNDSRRLCKAITEGMELQILAIGAIVLGFGWFGQWVIPLIFGARWLPVLEVYPYVALGYLSSAAFNVHSATMSVLGRNARLGLFCACHVALFAGVAAIAVPAVGVKGYGWGELAALPAYYLLHMFIVRAIGSPNYRVASLWWGGAAIGLFWREIGLLAIAAPFVALLVPVSLRELRTAYGMVLSRSVGMSDAG